MKHIEELLNQIENKSLLTIFPHPDDETVMGSGLIQRALTKGWKVKVLCLTKGDAGQCYVDKRSQTLSDIRSAEMKSAMEILNASYKLEDFPDGKLRELDDWKKTVKDSIETFNPGLVLTYDHSGVSGHPDHISVSLEVFTFLKQKNNIRLIWPSFHGYPRDRMVNKKVEKYAQKPTFKLFLSPFEIYKKWKAIRAHKSQSLGQSFPIPVWLALCLFPQEHFSEADFNKKYNHKFVDFKI